KVTFDPARFTRVIANLLNNASEAMVGRGDDPEKYTVREPRIVVATARTARGVEVTVSDNGPGMSAETQAKIMEPLFTTKSFGTGLGLPAIVKILEQHGGGLDVRSTPGSGASFTAWIKAEEAAIAA
ncbi:MAG: HAMP domain-containing histidine kinase, partial [Alphaproteobacteria bacterium]|nr:HAMP domain-containing histidine kinase [Alphaproteobacteria bacterium]